MQIFTDTKFQFMARRNLAVGISAALLIAALLAIFIRGFNLGIDFRGGSQVELRFAETVELTDLRSRLASLPEEISIQRVGDPDENTVLVRAGAADGEGQSDISARIVAALYAPGESAAAAAGRADLNQIGARDLMGILAGCPAPPADAKGVAEALMKRRTERHGLVGSYDAVAEVEGITPELRGCLERATFIPGFTKWKDDFVGPKVGAELRNQALWAIGFALAGILAYVWYRFQVQYAVGAVVALFHDVVVTTGFLVVLNEELSLTVVAALLTLAGYSVNDTIVVFDRIRENQRVMRTSDLLTIIDHSVNQTLSRTVLTSATTQIVVLTMLVFGGAEFHGFSLTLLIGITLGTYSSIFVASPLVVFWHDYFVRARSRKVARA